MAGHPREMAGLVERYLRGRPWPVRPEGIRLVSLSEQAPNPDSRVTLSEERDALGLRRARLDWRLTELDRRTIATMAETIAAGRRRSGMTTALGWFMHKYAAGIYGAAPNRFDVSAADLEDEAHPEAGAPPVPVARRIAGRGRIETYTVMYGRDQAPTRALVYGRTDAGLRFVANTAADASNYAVLTGENQVGRIVRLRTADGLSYADLE